MHMQGFYFLSGVHFPEVVGGKRHSKHLIRAGHAKLCIDMHFGSAAVF
jgi:phage protein U